MKPQSQFRAAKLQDGRCIQGNLDLALQPQLLLPDRDLIKVASS